MGITPKQKKIVEFIQRFQAKKGYAPSQREIADHFGYRSLGTVQNYLIRLARQGLLAKDWNSKRGLKLAPVAVAPTKPTLTIPTLPHSSAVTPLAPPPHQAVVRLPILGKVAAGRPIQALEPSPDAPGIEVPTSLLRRSGEHFILKVSGNSMIDEGILDGDFVVLRRQKNAENGETVVALVGNEATIKKFYRHSGGGGGSAPRAKRIGGEIGGAPPSRAPVIELRPANPAFAPIFIESLTDATPDFRIEGVLVGLIRKL